MKQVSLRNEQFKFKTFRRNRDHCKGIFGIYLNPIKKNQKITTWNWSDLEIFRF